MRIARMLRRAKDALGSVVSRLRSLMPPLTPKFIFLALLGVLLFLCGIVYGVWLIVRFRRYADG